MGDVLRLFKKSSSETRRGEREMLVSIRPHLYLVSLVIQNSINADWRPFHSACSLAFWSTLLDKHRKLRLDWWCFVEMKRKQIETGCCEMVSEVVLPLALPAQTQEEQIMNRRAGVWSSMGIRYSLIRFEGDAGDSAMGDVSKSSQPPFMFTPVQRNQFERNGPVEKRFYQIQNYAPLAPDPVLGADDDVAEGAPSLLIQTRIMHLCRAH